MPAGYKQARENMNDTSNGVNTHNGHEFVDLGLPSRTLWATCNVGATSPEQAGMYFAFGETTGYSAEQVKKGKRSFDFGSYDASSISGSLTLEQDAAHINMGGKWRMPTKRQFIELIENCVVSWEKNYNGTGVAGRVFTSKVNGNSVFFPAAGYCTGTSVHEVDLCGYHWPASWYSSLNAWCLHFCFKYIDVDLTIFRYYGRSVRGVCKK